MQTKLTLTIDNSVINQAKSYAKERHKSVSFLVEEYLRNITTLNQQNRSNLSINSPITDSLVGMFEDDGRDYKDMIAEAVAEKYL